MSKKSRKQRERKRVVRRVEDEQAKKSVSSNEIQRQQLSRQVRKDSLEYLVKWHTAKDQWKFQKTRQIWLLRNMYNIERVPIKHFKILKKYLKSMPEGPQKEKIHEKALELIENKDQIQFDDIETSLIEETHQVDRAALKDRIVNAKLLRAGKLAKALSKE